MPAEEVAALDARLAGQEEGVSIKQHPCFSERFRRRLWKPVFLKCVDDGGQIVGSVGLISFDIAGAKCGFVIDGPVFFGRPGCAAEEGEARTLVARLRAQGHAFVRFSHRDKAGLRSFLGLPEAVPENPLPFVLRYGGELLVPLGGGEAAMLAGFQQVARQEIRKAALAGCEVRQSSDPVQFRSLWPGFANRAREKGFRLGRLAEYEAMFALNQYGDFARLYVGYYCGQPVFSAVLLREATAAYYLLGALNVPALGGSPSPACLVHWSAMRDYRNLGCAHYNLGLPGGSVHASKKKFRPLQAPPPFTLTMVLRPLQYRAWNRVILPTLMAGIRAVQRMGGR